MSERGPDRRIVVQMAGSPGAGKSTLGRLIGRALRAVVIDKDILKSGMLDTGIEEAQAASAAYEVMFSLAGDLLAQGNSVVLDSPAFYRSIVTNGLDLAERHGAAYVFVECRCGLDVMRARLRGRAGATSQTGTATSRPSVTPSSGTVIVVDTEDAPERALSIVMERLGVGVGMRQGGGDVRTDRAFRR